MAQCEKGLAAKPKNLSANPGIHGQTELPSNSYKCPNMYTSVSAHVCVCVHANVILRFFSVPLFCLQEKQKRARNTLLLKSQRLKQNCCLLLYRFCFTYLFNFLIHLLLS